MLEVNHSKIKETNRKKIISLLLEQNEITKLDISKRLNISITTVSSNITQLKEEGFVEEVGASESTGGRKAVIIKLNENCRYSIGIAITPKNIKLSLVNLKKEVIDNIKVKHTDKEIERILTCIEENLKNLLDKNKVLKEQLLGIGISIPGTVDSENGVIKYSYLLGIKNFNLREKLNHLNIPIYVDNEANLSAFYEFLIQNKELENLLYVSITEGVGLGIIIDKKIYRGGNNTSGEIGHMKIAIDGRQCKCGSKGCLEAYTSKNVIIDLYNEIASNKIYDIEEFEEIYNKNDLIAKDILEKYVYVLGIGISNLVMLLDPNCIVLGGDINNLLGDKLSYLKNIIYKDNYFTDESNCNIKIADFKESYVLGAAMRPIHEFLTLK